MDFDVRNIFCDFKSGEKENTSGNTCQFQLSKKLI